MANFSALLPYSTTRVAAAAALIAGIAVVAAPASSAPAGDAATENFTATGSFSGIVPDGVCAVTATVLGGAGGSTINTGGANGAGASVTATFGVVPQQAFSGSVGGGGTDGANSLGNNGVGGVGGGGDGGAGGAFFGQYHHGAGGGGLSSLAFGATSMIVAGGGGGTGGGHATDGGFGGTAGLISAPGVAAGSRGLDGFDESVGIPGGGGGGQASTGGAGGTHSVVPALNGSDGSSLQGGQGGDDPNPDAGGGGGAGFFGGGGGAATDLYGSGAAVPGGNAGGGGGGGSSFLAAAAPDGSGQAPTAVSSVAGPQLGGEGVGADGSVTLDWVMCDYDLEVSKSVTPGTVAPGGTATWTVVVTNLGPDPMSRNDILTLGDSLPGAGATTISSLVISGGAEAVLDSAPLSCDAGVGDSMPTTLTCSRPYSASVVSSPTGSRGLNVGESVTIVYEQAIPESAGATLTNTATVTDRTAGDSNDSDPAALAVEEPPATLSGSVLDENSVAIQGVTITADDGVGGVFSTTTGADGSYSFSLPPGTYTVTESQPLGFGEGGQSSSWPGADASATNVISGITLASLDDSPNNNFVETYSSLAGTVYEDLDDSGTLNGLEPGITGVDMTLTGTDAAGSSVSLSTTTDANGDYSFGGLLSGTYVVTETHPTAYLDGTDAAGTAGGTPTNPGDAISAIALSAGTAATDYDFGEYPAASIAGTVVDDSGRPIEGVMLTLRDGANAVVGTTTTDANGDYSFGGLAPDTYTVIESQPAGYGDGSDTAGSVGGSTATNDTIAGIVLAAGVVATGYDFEETTGSLAGSVLDEYGAPIEGVQVALTGTDGLGNAVSLVTTTLADGSYLFDHVVGGTYTVTETQPLGFGDGPDSAGSAGGTVDSAADTISAVALAAAQDATGYDFTEVYASISGFTYLDGDLDGVYTAGVDVPLPGVEVGLIGLDAAGNSVTMTLSTAADGSYTFDDLLGGVYSVTETHPPAYVDGTDSVGTSGGTLANDQISGIGLAGGVDATGYNFGEEPPGGIAGSVTDTNGDPIPGVVLTLTGSDSNSNPVIRTTTTDASGDYSFSGLLPGTYMVTESQPTGYADSSTTAGTLGGDDSVENVISSIMLGLDPGTDAISNSNDFVEGYSSLAGTVFHDLNDDGVQDAGEVGIPGVEVTLSGTDAAASAVSLTVTTGVDGSYVFSDLLAGDYVVTEAQPAAYDDGLDTAGSAGGTAVNPGDQIVSIALPVGTNATDYDFAEVGTVLSGTVFVDSNRNGAIDSGELPLEGVTIELFDQTGTLVATTATDANGFYAFSGIPAGDYRVAQSQPSGYGSTTSSSMNVSVPLSGLGGVDFGEDLGSIGDLVWEDLNGNGTQDAGEPGVSGVTVTLHDEGGNAVATTMTDGNGNYLFDGLVIGTYVVTVDPASGLVFTEGGVGSTDTDSNVDWTTGEMAAVAVTGDGCPTASGICLLDRIDDVDAGLVVPVIDLSLAGTVAPTNAAIGDTITYEYTSINESNVPVAAGAQVTVDFPAGIVPTSASGDGWVVLISGSTVTLELAGPLLPGATLPPFSIETRLDSVEGGLAVNAAIGTLDGGLETTLANNTVPLVIQVLGDQLPATGVSSRRLLAGAAASILLGGALVEVARRRQSRALLT